jgi:two-component system sensor histidine kinase YcbA
MNQIEDLVGLSHRIKRMNTENEEMKALTLELSKGVHEIKKDYIRAVQGLEEIYDGEVNFDEITLKDLFYILDDNTKEVLRRKDSSISCVFKCKANTIVKEHFYMMSILRNLINNGIEACSGKGKVYITAKDIGDEVHITIKDDGKGISEEDREYIFNMGYSTKFDQETGDSYRGVGLALVKELIETIFKGSIDYESIVGAGTCFTIRMSGKVLEKGE